MSFINSFFLAGTVLIGLPVIIHLITRRIRRRQPLPTLRFLQRVQRDQYSWEHWQDWLLLLLRMLLIALVVLAFARPYWTEFTQATTSQSTDEHIAFLVDRSLTMDYGTDGTTLDRAKQAVRSVLEQNPADQYSLVSFDNRVNFVREQAEDPDAVQHALNEINVSQHPADAADAVQETARIPGLDRIMLISDFAAPTVENLHGQPNDRSYQLNLVDVSEPSRISRGIIDATRVPGTTGGFKLQTRSIGTSEPADIVVQNASGDTLQVVDDHNFEAERVELHIKPENLPATVTAQTTSDEFSRDDRLYLILEEPETKPLLYTADSQLLPYLKAFSGWFELKPISEGTDASPRMFLGTNDPELNKSTLKDFLSGGGEILITGKGLNRFSDEIRQLFLSRLGQWNGIGISNEGLRINRTGPLGGPYRDLSLEILRSPIHHQYVKLDLARDVEVFAQLENSSPYLVRTQTDQGTIWFWNIAGDGSWSTVTGNSLYPLTVFRVLDWSPTKLPHVYNVGEQAYLPGFHEGNLSGPDPNLSLQHHSDEGLRTQQLNKAGLYKIGGKFKFAVNPTPEATDLRTENPTRIQQRIGATTAGSIAENDLSFSRESTRHEIWFWLVLSALVLSFLELLLAERDRIQGVFSTR